MDVGARSPGRALLCACVPGRPLERRDRRCGGARAQRQAGTQDIASRQGTAATCFGLARGSRSWVLIRPSPTPPLHPLIFRAYPWSVQFWAPVASECGHEGARTDGKESRSGMEVAGAARAATTSWSRQDRRGPPAAPSRDPSPGETEARAPTRAGLYLATNDGGASEAIGTSQSSRKGALRSQIARPAELDLLFEDDVTPRSGALSFSRSHASS